MNFYGFYPCVPSGDRVMGVPNFRRFCDRSACPSVSRRNSWSIRSIRGKDT